MQYIGELTGDQIINMIDEEIKLIDYTGDITLTNTTTKKTLIITTNNKPLIITPKKPTQFLDLPVEIRQIIKNYAFNDNTKEMKEIFKNEYTNISNMVLLKNMFGEYPKELILNNNRYYNEYYKSISKIPDYIYNKFTKILNKYNLIKYKDFKIKFFARIYNDLNFDFIIDFNQSYNPYILHTQIFGPYHREYIDNEKKDDTTIYINKNGCIYDHWDDWEDGHLEIDNLIGGIKYKDMYEIINHIKNIVYNS